MNEEPNNLPQQDQILTLKEVAAYLKLADRTVYLYAQTGKLPGIKIGSAWRFRRVDIDRWLDEQRTLTESSTSNSLGKQREKESGR